jgi:hypothetical protein
VKVRILLIAGAGIVATITAVAFALLSSDDGESSDPNAVSYPDLQPLPADFVRVSEDKESGEKTLRFESTIWNGGDGPLEVRPENVEAEAETVAYQRLYHVPDDGEATLVSESYIGAFLFHPEHKHWHLGDFADYKLHAVANDGGISDEVVAESRKVSFCLLDEEEINLDLHAAPSDRQYTKCKVDNTQGISIGWADSYESFLPGQNIDITGVPDGDYWLVFTVDPDNLIEESDDENNQSSLKIDIDGTKVTVLSATPTPKPSRTEPPASGRG